MRVWPQESRSPVTITGFDMSWEISSGSVPVRRRTV